MTSLPPIIGLSGKARSGKDTVADMLVQQYGYVRVSWATALKKAVKDLFGWTEDHVNGHLKEVLDDYWGMSPRVVMQRFGTEGMRTVFGEGFWIRVMERQLERIRAEQWPAGMRLNALRFVIPDTRFPNEAGAIHEWGGQVWRLERLDGRPEIAGHSSEVALDNYKDFDWTIHAVTGVPALQSIAADVLTAASDTYQILVGSNRAVRGERQPKAMAGS